VKSPGEAQHIQAQFRDGLQRWRWVAVAAALSPLSLLVAQCSKSPNATMLAANSQASVSEGDTFDDRFPAPSFRDRFPSPSESLQWPSPDAPRRTAQAQPAPYRVASLAPTLPYQAPAKEDLTTLVSLKSSAFPYFGNNPRTEAPFLDISRGDRRGHRSYGGRVFWQDQTFSDSRTLMHIP
jgi:hypothetical protein